MHALDTNDGPELQDFRNRRSVSADRLLWAEASQSELTPLNNANIS